MTSWSLGEVAVAIREIQLDVTYDNAHSIWFLLYLSCLIFLSGTSPCDGGIYRSKGSNYQSQQ